MPAVRLELTSLATHAPKACAYSNSATPAYFSLIIRRIDSEVKTIDMIKIMC